MLTTLSTDLLSRVEDAGLNASAPPQQRWIDGWLVRFSPGKAKRARCVNAVAPGFIDTAMTQGLSSDVKDQLQKQIPLGRLGTPNDIANAVRFLVSEEAAYVTGHVLHVNGGMLMS